MRALPFLLALALPAVALAEPVTYHLTGTVDSVDNGTGNTLDLTGSFSPGTAFTLDLPVERSTVPLHPDQFTSLYSNIGTNAHFTIGSYACTGAPMTALIIDNDMYGFDDFNFVMYTVTAPPIGSIYPAIFELELQDAAGTALGSTLLPRPMPDMSAWTTKVWILGFSDNTTTGVVSGTLGAVSTPALSTTWGGIRALYRR